MGFRLCEERIAVVADEISETNAAGLYVPDGGQEILRYGTVVSVGVGRRSDTTGELIPIDIQVGDRVFWPRMVGQPLTVEGQEYVFLAPREIIGVVDPVSE